MYNIEEDLDKIKNCLTNMFIAFNNLNNNDAKVNRNSDIQDTRLIQFSSDKAFINSLRNNALTIFDKCNKLMMIDKTNI